ncbi:YihY/virulence factor BrkB family protein [Marinobacter salicampi]|uniref:YihY/virulence factor BrkB family protein n=1 Tax=Marinobacter salicampi TaxID=435907 RepID=UPI001A9455EC|nr:YihY/virulence factor BrkB family protein [Marinobacter salicampi]
MSKIPRSNSEHKSRGRSATVPGEIPRKGWRDIFLRIKDAVGDNNLSLIAAGVAFYFLLAVFPSITAFLSIYGLVLDPEQAQAQVNAYTDILPEESRALLVEQTNTLTGSSSSALGFGVVFSLALALWSARRGTAAMTIALGVVYNEHDDRSLIKQVLMSLLLTVSLILFFIVSLAVIAAAPALLGILGLGTVTALLVDILRWPILAIIAMVALTGIYRFGPDRHSAQWRWLTPGAIFAVVAWLAMSGLFSWYVSNFGNFNEMYGSVGAVVILLFWFYLTAFIFLLGAQLDAEMEHQTAQDTTVGEERPMGERGAHVADHLGEKP